jgi:hypothetical protein
MCDNVQNASANRRSIASHDMPWRDITYMPRQKTGSRSPYPEDKIMQSDQRTTHHPIPFRNTERTSDNDENDDTAESYGKEKYRESSDRHDAIKPATGRRPARSAENMPRYPR